MKNLVTEKERRDILKNESLVVGEKYKFTVIDADKVGSRLVKERVANGESLHININPVGKVNNDRRVPHRGLTYQKDPITGVYYGLFIGLDRYDAPMWQKINMEEYLPLNLENDTDKKIWAVIRFHPLIKGSPFQADLPMYEILDPDEQSRKDLFRVELMKEAFNLVDKISENPRELVQFLRYMGEDVDNSNSLRITTSLASKIAMNSPEKIIASWKDKDRAIKQSIANAIKLGIIEEVPSKGFVFNNIPIGQEVSEVVYNLKNDMNLVTAIGRATNKADVLSVRLESEFGSNSSLSSTVTKTSKTK